MVNKEKSKIEKFWEEMPIEKKTKLLKDNNYWTGVSTYLWKYIPEYIRSYIDDEYQKSRR